jgi:hypothetical protein
MLRLRSKCYCPLSVNCRFIPSLLVHISYPPTHPPTSPPTYSVGSVRSLCSRWAALGLPPPTLPRREMEPRRCRASESQTRACAWASARGTRTLSSVKTRQPPLTLPLLAPPPLAQPLVLLLPQPLEAVVVVRQRLEAVVRQRKRHAGGSWTRPSAWVGAPGTQTSAFATTRRPPQPLVLL